MNIFLNSGVLQFSSLLFSPLAFLSGIGLISCRSSCFFVNNPESAFEATPTSWTICITSGRTGEVMTFSKSFAKFSLLPIHSYTLVQKRKKCFSDLKYDERREKTSPRTKDLRRSVCIIENEHRFQLVKLTVDGFRFRFGNPMPELERCPAACCEKI